MGDGPDDVHGRGELIAQQRRETVQRLRARGVEPFALTYSKDADAADVRAEFGDIEPGAGTGAARSVAGRIVLLRRQGKVAFAQLRDRSGDIQLFMAENAMPAQDWALLEDVDLFDIVGAASYR